MRPYRRTHADAGSINVTPLIDVVMCLIIFYLLVGRLALDRDASIQLPRTAVGTPTELPATLTIAVAGDASGIGSILVDGVEASIPQLEERLAQATLTTSPGATRVQIRADGRLPYAAIAPVFEACRRARLASVRLTTVRDADRPTPARPTPARGGGA